MAVPSGDVVFELVLFQIHRPVLKVIFHQTVSFFFGHLNKKTCHRIVHRIVTKFQQLH